MRLLNRGVAVAAFVGFAAALGPVAAPAAPAEAVGIEALPGTVVRWSAPGTRRCGMGRRSWAALKETCYYPIDLLQKPGELRISRRGAGRPEPARITVLPAAYGSEDIQLGDTPQANPSPADLQRNARDQALVAKVWTRRERPARFTLPLAAPASPLPEGKGFGATWVFNGKPESSEAHSGADYPLAAGTTVGAVADGTVALAKDLFFTGNAVFVDHGDGLVSMYFHFSELKVRTGEEVKQGQALGLVGSTGRATGPHLHLGVRWHGARIDPQALLGDPAKLPAVAP